MMKGIKLKPLFLKDTELFISPPRSLSLSLPVTQKDSIDDLEHLREMLRGRKLNKLKAQDKKKEETDQVKNLSDFSKIKEGSPRFPGSPLLRKFTFRKNLTLRSGSDLISLVEVKQPLPKNKPLENINSIIRTEKRTRQRIEEESLKSQRTNKQYEEYQKIKFDRINQELSNLSRKIGNLKLEINELEAAFEVEDKRAEETISNLTEKLTKVTRKISDAKVVGEKDKLFIEKTHLTTEKQEKVQEFFKSKHKHEKKISELQNVLEENRMLKRRLKKELKDIRSNLMAFFCKILKKGIDVRTEGLKWVIKSIWSMNESVPISSFPKFLDDDSRYFLLQLAKYDIEMQEFKLRLEKLSGQTQKLKLKDIKKDPQNMLSTVRHRLKELSKPTVGVLPNMPANVSVDSAQNTKKSSFYSEICWVRENIDRINENVEKNMKNEVKRVTEEYQKSTDKTVGLEHIFHCLIGDRAKEFKKFFS